MFVEASLDVVDLSLFKPHDPLGRRGPILGGGANLYIGTYGGKSLKTSQKNILRDKLKPMWKHSQLV